VDPSSNTPAGGAADLSSTIIPRTELLSARTAKGPPQPIVTAMNAAIIRFFVFIVF
jgi:hypothetical protein